MSKPRGKMVLVTPARHPWSDGGTRTITWPAKAPKGCEGCIHMARVNGHGAYYCNYLGNTGVSRVKIRAFAGANGGCPVRQEGEKVDRRRMEPSTHAVRMRMYEAGMTDSEIAAAQGVAPSTIANWRIRYSLPCLYKQGGGKKK